MALNLVKRPWAFDVLVTENMFGDILSDLGAALMGGMGLAPSADIGVGPAVFQPCHGSAPDIAGTGTANPTATFLSAAMMLEWLGDRHEDAKAAATGRLIAAAVEQAFAGGDLVPVELGGTAGTGAITARVLGLIRAAAEPRSARDTAGAGR
jgi:3-isopropylmalate dehydrogenase